MHYSKKLDQFSNFSDFVVEKYPPIEVVQFAQIPFNIPVK